MQEEIKFFGTDILKYYWYLLQNQFADSSWQITISYAIVIICIIAISIVTFSFLRRHYKRRHSNKRKNQLLRNYEEQVRELLLDDMKNEVDVYEVFSDSRIKRDAKYFIDMIIDIRNSLHKISYIPNIQHVCDATGVTEYIENNLLNNINVFESLNSIITLQLRISEGRLANYVNHKNKAIRTFARVAYMICGTKNPYKYLEQLLDDNDSEFTYLSIHYTLMWLKEQNIKMPNFSNIIDDVKSESSAVFIIRELPKLLDDENEVSELLMKYIKSNHSEKKKIAAIQTTEKLNNVNKSICETLIKNFSKENTRVQHIILNNMLIVDYSCCENISQFFINAFKESSDNKTKDLSLRGLYKYDIDEFLKIHTSGTLSQNDKMLTDVIESEGVLKNLRNL